MSLEGKNLLEPTHQESAGDIFLTVPVVIERHGSVLARRRF